MTEADATLLGNRTGDAERLQALADNGGCLGSFFHTALKSECHTQGIRPHCVFERDGLYAFDNSFHINALAQAKLAASFH